MGKLSKRGSQAKEETILVARFRENTFLRVAICPVSGCIGRIEEKFDVESFITTVQCYNQGTMTKVKNSVLSSRCCYSYSDYCLKATELNVICRKYLSGRRR